MNKETAIMRNIEIQLSARNCLCLRTNSGIYYSKQGQPVRIGFPGLSDLVIVRPDGQVAFLEVKTGPTAHRRPEQIKFINAMRKRGHIADFVWSEGQAVETVFSDSFKDVERKLP